MGPNVSLTWGAMGFARWIGLAFLFAVMLSVAVASAQTTETETQTIEQMGSLTPAERMALLARLSDAQVREILIQYMAQTQVQEADPNAGVMMGMQAETDRLRDNLRQVVMEIANLPTVLPFVYDRLTEGRSDGHLWLVALGIIIFFSVGSFAEWTYRRGIRTYRARLLARLQRELDRRAGLLGLLAALDLIGLAIFLMAVVASFFVVYQGHLPTRLAVMGLVAGVTGLRFAGFAGRLVLAPNKPHLRLIGMPDDAARRLYGYLMWTAGVGIFGFLACTLVDLLGIAHNLYRLLLLITAIIFVGLLLLMIWRTREGIAKLIRSEKSDSRLQDLTADTWHILASIYVIGILVVAVIRRLLDHPVGIAVPISSLLIIVIAPPFYQLIRSGLNRFFAGRLSSDDGKADYLEVLNRTAKLVVAVGVIVILADLWGVGIQDMADDGVSAAIT